MNEIVLAASAFGRSSPYLATFVVLCMVGGLSTVANNLIRLAMMLVNRPLRTLKVLVRGWPPAHLDADGDFKPAPKKAD